MLQKQDISLAAGIIVVPNMKNIVQIYSNTLTAFGAHTRKC